MFQAAYLCFLSNGGSWWNRSCTVLKVHEMTLEALSMGTQEGKYRLSFLVVNLGIFWGEERIVTV